jgi:hypothetical protein
MDDAGRQHVHPISIVLTLPCMSGLISQSTCDAVWKHIFDMLSKTIHCLDHLSILCLGFKRWPSIRVIMAAFCVNHYCPPPTHGVTTTRTQHPSSLSIPRPLGQKVIFYQAKNKSTTHVNLASRSVAIASAIDL